ncbi:MAG: LamG-like jellyroll fold domain-containing protein [Planctomycetota bacterium]|jgi:hypothetical protein
MSNSPGTARVLELVEKFLNETASGKEMTELESLMTSEPELRRVYLRYAMVHAQLALTTTGLPEIAAPEVSLWDTHDDRSGIRQNSLSPRRTDLNGSSGELHFDTGRSSNRNTFLITVVAAAALVLVSVGIYFVGSPNERGDNGPTGSDIASNDAAAATDGHYDNRNLPLHIVGALETDRLSNISPTTFTVRQGSTRLTTADGTDVRIEGPAMFGASSSSEGVLFEGSVQASLTRPGTNYTIQTAALRVVDRGAGFRVATAEQERIRVDVLDGEVEVQSRVRSPLYYWSFDGRGSAGRAEPASDLRYIGDHIRQSPGLVGGGALVFENQNDSFVRIETGTGPEVGTGEMSCSSGISIEAIVISNWSGRHRDYDEIFRKEDGNHRMLLSLQNDGDYNDFDFPEVIPGPCLSFGLHLEGHGYSELDMPLDGNDGRPNLSELTDGQPHHIVATYDSFSGRKAIYIDGRLRFSHDFPVGTLILSGGPSPAEIGNHHNREPFTGTIDEVAFYDFALSPAEIADHHQRAMRGESYFAPNSSPERWQSIMLVRAGSSKVFNSLTGIPIQ